MKARITIPQKYAGHIKAISKSEGVSADRIVERALRTHLERNRKNV